MTEERERQRVCKNPGVHCEGAWRARRARAGVSGISVPRRHVAYAEWLLKITDCLAFPLSLGGVF